MAGKAWKIAREVAIGAILLLTLALVISGALKNAGIIEKPEIFLMLGTFLKNIQYGTLSDWISSISTFFTLVVAFLAYKNAPKWLSQKLDDHAINIAKELITTSFPTMYKDAHYFGIKLSNFQKTLKNTNIELAYASFSKDFKDLEKMVIAFEQAAFHINLQTSSLEKLGWKIKPHLSEASTNLSAAINLYAFDLTVINESLIKISEYDKKYPGLGGIATSLSIKNEFAKIVQAGVENFGKLTKSYEELITPIDLITDYFDITSLKVK